MQPQQQADRTIPSRHGDASEQSSRLASVAGVMSYLQIGMGLALLYGHKLGYWSVSSSASTWGVMFYIGGITIQNSMPLIRRLGVGWNRLNRSRVPVVREPTTIGEHS